MDFKDITRLRTLYRSLVRPLPKYSCETWNPQTQRNYNRIEAIQRRATKFILKYNEDYNIRLKQLDLQSLYNRRFSRDVVFLFNLMKEHYNIDISDKLLFCKKRNVDYNLRKNDSLDLVSMYSRSISFKNSYLLRIINEWNSLPSGVEESVGIFLVLSIKLYNFLAILSSTLSGLYRRIFRLLIFDLDLFYIFMYFFFFKFHIIDIFLIIF